MSGPSTSAPGGAVAAEKLSKTGSERALVTVWLYGVRSDAPNPGDGALGNGVS